MMIFPEIYTS